MLFPRNQKGSLDGEWKGTNMTQKQNNAKPAVDWKEIFRSERDGMRALIQQVVQDVLEAEMDEAVGAQKSERSEARVGYRAGYYTRTLVTRVGKLVLRVPQDRQGRFRTEVFERYQRSEKSAGRGVSRDVRAGGIDAEGQRDHRGVVRARIFVVGNQPGDGEAGPRVGAVRAASTGRGISVCGAGRAL